MRVASSCSKTAAARKVDVRFIQADMLAPGWPPADMQAASLFTSFIRADADRPARFVTVLARSAVKKLLHPVHPNRVVVCRADVSGNFADTLNTHDQDEPP